MNNRRPVFIVIIALVLICSVTLAVLVILKTSQPVIDDGTPDSFPVQHIPGSDDNEVKKYSYALINTADNVKLKTTLGEELLINIDTKSWKSIRWSKNGTYVAVLGETKKDIFNIFIYNVSSKNWIQATVFDKDTVTSFEWVDNDTILFTQDGWLHRYKYSSLNEIVKIYEIQATIVDLSPNKSTVLLKDTNQNFVLLSVDGKLLFTLQDLGIKNKETSVTITNVYFNRNSENLLFTTSDNKIYSWDLGATNAKEVSVDPTIAENSELNITCSEDINQFQVYTIKEQNTVNFYNLNSSTSELTLNASKSSEQPVKKVQYSCLESRMILNIKDEKASVWYKLENDSAEKLVILDEATEVDFKD